MANVSVSVIIPHYNREDFIEETLKSVVDQTCEVREIIIVDDGSTPSSLAKLKLLASRYPKVQIIEKNNGGQATARNLGVKYATGEFISFLDSDDLWHCEKIEKQLCLLKTNNEIGLVYSNFKTFFSNADGSKVFSQHTIERVSVEDAPSRLLTENFIYGSASSVLIPKDVFNKVGLFDENLKAVEDLDLWRRISKCYKLAYVDEEHVYIRVHPNQQQADLNFMFREHMKYYWKIRGEYRYQFLNRMTIEKFMMTMVVRKVFFNQTLRKPIKLLVKILELKSLAVIPFWAYLGIAYVILKKIIHKVKSSLHWRLRYLLSLIKKKENS